MEHQRGVIGKEAALEKDDGTVVVNFQSLRHIGGGGTDAKIQYFAGQSLALLGHLLKQRLLLAGQILLQLALCDKGISCLSCGTVFLPEPFR